MADLLIRETYTTVEVKGNGRDCTVTHNNQGNILIIEGALIDQKTFKSIYISNKVAEIISSNYLSDSSKLKKIRELYFK